MGLCGVPWDEEILESEWVSDGYRDESEERTYLDHARQVLGQYHRENGGSFRIPAALEFRFTVEIEGAQISGVAYVQGIRAMQEARRGAADSMLEGIDVLMTPTCAIAAPTIADSRKEDPSRRLAALTAPIDFTGQPALSIPCGLTSVKLPVGLQIIGRRWDETSVLWAGRAYEQVRGPFPVPPLALNT